MGRTSSKVRNRWDKKNYFRINITVPKGKKDLINQYAGTLNMTVNGLANMLLMREFGMSQSVWGLNPQKIDNEVSAVNCD